MYIYIRIDTKFNPKCFIWSCQHVSSGKDERLFCLSLDGVFLRSWSWRFTCSTASLHQGMRLIVSSRPSEFLSSLACQFSWCLYWGGGLFYSFNIYLLMITFFIQSASVDVDRIVREMDVKTLQDNIMHVTFSNIEAELVGVFMTEY